MTLVNPESQLKSTPDGDRSRPEESNKVCEEDSDLKILISNRFYLFLIFFPEIERENLNSCLGLMNSL